ncbi:MAG: hypothetical protein HC924_18865 [Synechococcaceae cyanobacterium SM2_3_2]|nr:hypothetical protein [Synechococcaceae cyanobacterium SM2_3_2]
MTTIAIPYMPELARELAPHVGHRIADKCAIFLQQVAYWQARTSKHKDSERGWVWKTIKDWSAELFWSIPTISRIAKVLTDLGGDRARKEARRRRMEPDLLLSAGAKTAESLDFMQSITS